MKQVTKEMIEAGLGVGALLGNETKGEKHMKLYVENYGMTMRQYAAIKLKVPNSGTDWLDEMIRTSLRDDIAAKAMDPKGFNVRPYDTTDAVAKDCYAMADAMLRLKGARNDT
jgi:homogentisate 1,2-dioxygenase